MTTEDVGQLIDREEKKNKTRDATRRRKIPKSSLDRRVGKTDSQTPRRRRRRSSPERRKRADAGAAQLDAGGVPGRDARARALLDGITTRSRSRASSLARIGRASPAHGARRARRRCAFSFARQKTQAGGECDPWDEGSGSHCLASVFGAIEPHVAYYGVREARRASG
jgi:hypothetical protein